MTKTKKASTDLWKLDLLEANVYRTTPRLRRTRKLLTSKKCPKIVSSITKSQTDIESYIIQLKEDVLAKKYHSAHTKLKRHINNQASNDLSKWKRNGTEKEVAEFLSKAEVIDNIIKSRLIKCMINVFLTKKDGKLTAPSFISADTREAMTNKQHELHPSAIFKSYFQSNKELNNYFSNIWNTKTFKRLAEDIEWAFKQVRGGITTQEKNARKSVTKELDGSVKGESDLSSDSDSDFDSEDDSENNSGDGGDNKTHKSLKDIAASSRDTQDDESDSSDEFAEYDNLVQGSDSEDNDEESNQGRSNEVNYNEVTDEESEDELSEDELSPNTSDEEDDSEKDVNKEKKKEKKNSKPYKLPELAVGYFSGDSDDDIADVDDDDVVREATTKRKNRRGQRARQKLWAKKFGKEATHIKKKIDHAQQEREKKQKEFEERERRRQLKRQRENDNEYSSKPSDSSTSREPESNSRIDINHPSWEAKKKAEEKIKNAKFQGKKLKFS
ncbi:Piso0_000530 [Millerozyma farinosa CBS 7064]|uniref:Piso0_000530 protein n=1 Tax=Pichia sorbitophila (strain ATCC MYA-4447 / BCRC 22081 / CBS 7064 / NBRC 10061 / NRRL Y-12695) TaxID=559304 RepID=G8YVP2_PICSO|nr:Piso0_000530 [Millerozyma farinosa CBS 7064]CCE73486.1 Piso0_000530 [Millerozyma farinosa CBS 7064]